MMRVMVLELYDGQADKNLESLLHGEYITGIEFVRINLETVIPDVVKECPSDYFEYLQSAPVNYDTNIIDRVTGLITKEYKTFDYIVCPLGTDIKGSVLGYVLSWILSYMDLGAIRGAVYYADKHSISDEGSSAKSLYESFKDLFEFEQLTTSSGDILFMDMPKRHKPFFTKLGVKEE
jgi:hypothetical protein